jgi:alpha-glucoside transport system substrate-binding protein
MNPRPVDRLFVLFAVLALALGACGPVTTDAGPSLSVFGPWRGADAEDFRATLEQFGDESGIDVRYIGSAAFAEAIRDRVEEGDAPDVAVFPQPGLVRDLAAEGQIASLPVQVADLATDGVVAGVGDVAAELAAAGGVLFRLNVKSLVWYSPAEFVARGYEVPETWADLAALSRRMAADGVAPWCIGISAFGATGWPATDWVEDIVLRLHGTSVYDEWTAGTVPFTAEEIGDAIDTFGDLVLTDAFGGRRATLNTSPARAQDPMFGDPPGCLMYKMASFHLPNVPDELEIGPGGDIDVFVLPGAEPGSAPVVIGGAVAAAFVDSEPVWQLMGYLASAQSGVPWAERGEFVSPHRDFPTGSYSSDFDRRMAALVNEAGVVRFDGSDLMTARVGAGTFFDAMANYVLTQQTELAQQIAQLGYDP